MSAEKRYRQDWDAPGIHKEFLTAILEDYKPSAAIVKKVIEYTTKKGHKFTFSGLEYFFSLFFSFASHRLFSPLQLTPQLTPLYFNIYASTSTKPTLSPKHHICLPLPILSFTSIYLFTLLPLTL